MSAIARPQLRGLLKSTLKRHVIIASSISFVSTVAWRVYMCDNRKNKYTEFWRTYDVQKDFERMKVAGVFQSINPDGSMAQNW